MNTRRAMPSKTALRRRTFLRGSLGLGAGALVGLPLLEAMRILTELLQQRVVTFR